MAPRVTGWFCHGFKKKILQVKKTELK